MTIAGPYELMRPREKQLNSKKRTILSKVFAALSYDLGVLAPEEGKLFSQPDALPEWLAVGGDPKTAVLTVMDRSIGVIALPHFGGGQDWDRFIQDLQPKISSLRMQSDLLIGVSSWGFNLENHFLTGPDSGLDILLGSGPGPAFRGKLMNHNNTLWIRPYSRGRALNTITIPNFKATSWLIAGWKLNSSITTGIAMIRGNMPEDPAVSAIINGKDN